MIRDWLYRMLPKPAPGGASVFDPSRVRRIIVFCEGPNPTFTYYLEERLKRVSLPVDVIYGGSPSTDLSIDGAFVILVRYARPKLIYWLFTNRDRLAGLALLIDDDMAATAVSEDASLLYNLHVLRLGILPLPFLNRWMTHLWVSTAGLKDALQAGDIVSPMPTGAAIGHDCAKTFAAPASGGDRVLLMAFHATGAHHAEHKFLIPIVRNVLSKFEKLAFEVIAEPEALGMWRDQLRPFRQRLTAKPGTGWPEYFQETGNIKRDLVLVPILPNRVNNVRSDTKRIDIARMGAAAIFSRHSVYHDRASAGEVFVDSTEAAWVKAITAMLSNRENLTRSAAGNKSSLRKMVSTANSTLPGLSAYF